MTTIIERAAQAMHASAGPEWSWDDPEYPQLRAIYRDAARAMIKSLREPNAAMLDAGYEIIRNVRNTESDFAIRDDTKAAWLMMIDAALDDAG